MAETMIMARLPMIYAFGTVAILCRNYPVSADDTVPAPWRRAP